MKNDLTCGVVRDLLPSYVEGLTSPESNTAVERHLSECPDCAQLRTALAGAPKQAAPEDSKEVDYLKKVKRRGWRRVAAAVAVTGSLPTGTTGRISTGRLTQMCRDSWICISIPNGLILPTVTGWWKTKTASFVSAQGRSCRHSFMMPPTIGSIFRWMVCGKFGWPIN